MELTGALPLMLIYFIRRLLYILPISVGVTLFVFSLVHLAPGDPLTAVVSADTPPELAERLRADYGFDKPLAYQYVHWLGRALTGDLGLSSATGRSVLGELLPAVLNTTALALSAALVGFSIGCLLGGIAGYFAGTWIDRIATVASITGLSVPYYWLGIVLVIVFAVELNLLPALGMWQPPPDGENWGWAQFRHLVLPAVALSVVPIGVVARTVRTCVAETVEQGLSQTLQ